MIAKIKELYNRAMNFIAGKLHWVFDKLDTHAQATIGWIRFKDAEAPTLKEATIAFLCLLATLAIGVILAGSIIALIGGFTWLLAFILPPLAANLIGIFLALCLYSDLTYRLSAAAVAASIKEYEAMRAAKVEPEVSHA